MDACLQGSEVEVDIRTLYDLRYLYVDEGIGHCTCGTAFEAMMSKLREHRLNEFCGQEWYSAVQRSSGNPVMQGFLAEHICLNQIATNGLKAVDSSLGRMSHFSFSTEPNWDSLLSTDH